MRKVLLATLGLVLVGAQAIWAETTTLRGIIAEMRMSSDAVHVQILGHTLSQLEPKTAEDVGSLVSAMGAPAIAPYAQIAMASTTDIALGPVVALNMHSCSIKLRFDVLAANDAEIHKRVAKVIGIIFRETDLKLEVSRSSVEAHQDRLDAGELAAA